MKRDLNFIQSRLIDGHIGQIDDQDLLSLSKDDQTLLQFCMFELDDDKLIDFCNFILQATDLISDRFEFSRYEDYYCYEMIFNDTVRDNSYLSIYVENFPRQVTLQYHSYLSLDEITSFTKYFDFTSLEDAEHVINEFMHQIYQLKEK